MARPRGEFTTTLLDCLKAGPATSRELAARGVLSADVATYALRNMVARGEVVNVEPVRRPGVKRPVPVYALAPEGAGLAADPFSVLQGCISAWRVD